MKVTNKSNKVIGFGEVTILPGKTEEIPVAYEKSPVLDFYKKNNFITVTGKPSIPDKTPEQIAAEKTEAEKKAVEEKEIARNLAETFVNSLKAGSLTDKEEYELCRVAELYGVNPAECKDQADVLKKVKAALKK